MVTARMIVGIFMVFSKAWVFICSPNVLIAHLGAAWLLETEHSAKITLRS
jgi:hypothetical protein